MPNHTEATIGYQVAGASLTDRLEELEKKLIADLYDNFKKVLGIPLPSADQCALFRLDTAMKWHYQVSPEEFRSGIVNLVTGIFGTSEIADKAIVVAESAMNNIINVNNTVLAGFQGDSAKIMSKGETYIAACYSATEFCSKNEWGTENDFYVAKFVFTVFSI